MKKVLKWAGLIVILLVAVMIIYSLFGMKQTLSLQIQDVDLSRIPDGTYTGTYECYRWTNSVAVTVEDHRITAIEPLVIQDGRDDLAAELTQKIIDAQTPDVDAVSGATASKNGFLKAVETALKNAGT